MTIREIKQLCPDAIHLPSDYETYSLFPQRMFAIVRRYTPDVEEYSIDECFCDLTGLRRPLHVLRDHGGQHQGGPGARPGPHLRGRPGAHQGRRQARVQMAKAAGLTIIRGTDLHVYLDQVPIENVWGIGPQTTAYLTRFGMHTALDFARRDELWVRSKLTKPHQDIWHELRGTAVIPLEFGEHHAYQSISKTKTFTRPPPTGRCSWRSSRKTSKTPVSRLGGTIGSPACELFCAQDFRHTGYELVLSRPPMSPASSCRSSTRT